ncbi:MAG: hypothetical protein MR019_04275 [Ruminococcus sp.]|nr:hypothetical protein [Ruminococcus sp.]
MKGYKAFRKGMICAPDEQHIKQYAENTVFEEDSAEVCKKGMHFCKDPLAVLDYYPLVDENGDTSEFAEVEALDECKTDDGQKYCTKKLKVGAKLSFSALVQASVNFELEKSAKTKTHDMDDEKISSKSNSAQIGSSGDWARIGSSGNSARIGSSGDSARIGSSGDSAQIGSSGDWAQIGSSGDWAQIGSSGDSAQIGSSGDSARIGSSGDWARIGSSGNSAQIGSSGDSARIGSSGYGAQIGSSGDSAQIGSSGDWARIASSGKHSVICCAGNGSIVKAKIGSWVTLAEWLYDKVECAFIPVCVKTEYVDGEKIKADTPYKLVNGRFEEVKG